MSKVRHILRLYSQQRSKRKIAELTGVSRNTLKKYIDEFTKSKLSFGELKLLQRKCQGFLKPIWHALLTGRLFCLNHPVKAFQTQINLV